MTFSCGSKQRIDNTQLKNKAIKIRNLTVPRLNKLLTEQKFAKILVWHATTIKNMGQLLAGPKAKFLGGQQAMAHPQRPHEWCATVTIRTFTFNLSSVSSSSITRQLHGFVVEDAPPASLFPSAAFVCRCLSNFLLNACGINFDKADNIAVDLMLATKASGQLYPTKSNRLSYLISPQRLIDISSIFSQPLFTQPLRLQLLPRMHVASSATDCPRRPSSSFLPTKQCELISRPLGRRLSWPWSPAA